jgi:hypothetical protein
MEKGAKDGKTARSKVNREERHNAQKKTSKERRKLAKKHKKIRKERRKM